MITKLFLGFTLVGAQWVLWFLILLSIVSIALILERWRYFKSVSSVLEKKISDSLKSLQPNERIQKGVFLTDSIVAETRLGAEAGLSWLATIGYNAPFVGLFGTVLGIIRAFHDLSTAGTQGSSVVTAGISEALVATAIGLFVAIPAVVAYNHFQRKIKNILLNAERVKSLILGS